MKKTRAIKVFVKKWRGRGKEKQDAHPFWEELVECLLDVKHGRDLLDYEKPVPKLALVTEEGQSPKYIDCYLKESKCVIEQKSHNIPLDKPHAQSDGKKLTALEQAQRYYNHLSLPDQGNYTIACNFKEFKIFDNTNKEQKPVTLALEELPRKWRYLHRVLKGGETKTNEDAQDAAAKTASGFVGQLYNLLLKQYSQKELTPDILHQLNVFCVRVVFCLYADDAEVFDNNQFHTFLNTFDARKLQEKFKWLFCALNQSEHSRPDSYDIEIKDFPYVNGGLFGGEEIPIPRLSDQIRDLLLNGSDNLYLNNKSKEPFEWSLISPTNFGCIFESTLDPATRKKNGMHYTSPKNIHRVIDPLFLDDLTIELNSILAMPRVSRKEKDDRENALKIFQRKIAKLRFLDPACGSGNFLTETFKSLRRLEMKVVNELPNYGLEDGVITEKNQSYIKNPCLVNINQFYGIEINDFAVQVANTALWISDCQMIAEAEELFNVSINPLPLAKNQNIYCANALEMGWKEVISPRALNYIIGNPPFKGARGAKDTKEEKAKRKAEMKVVLSDLDKKGRPVWQSIGNLDYVCAWYALATQYMQQNPAIRAALVSTNSIVQGEQAVLLWKPLMEHFNLKISFAWRSFIWNNQAKTTAQVHCVIVGFYCSKRRKPGDCHIYQESQPVITCERINNYLYPSPCYFINPGLSKPLCDVPNMLFGNMPNDNGLLSNFSAENRYAIIQQYPKSERMFRRFLGAQEYINNEERWCLWLKNIKPDIIRSIPPIYDRIKKVRNAREKSTRSGTRKAADYPSLFGEIRQPEMGRYIIVPRHSSENRDYIPMGFISSDIICGDSNLMVTEATLYHFGILESSVHIAWIRVVCGRLKSDYRYSKDLVYNNFPWPKVTEEQKQRIEQTAQGILDARSQYPESNLAVLYDSSTMHEALRKAHQDNDKAVFAVYSSMDICPDMSDEEIAQVLLRESVRLSKAKNKKVLKHK